MKISAKKFSEENKISQDLAKKILDALYLQWYDAKSFDRVLYRMRSSLEKKVIPDLMEKMNNAQIEQIIQEMAIEDQPCDDGEIERYSENPFGIWLFSELWSEFADKVFNAGDKVEIQIMRVWTRNHPMYWKIVVDKQVLKDVVKNFEDNARWIDLAVDENHEPNHKALWWYKALTIKWNDLFATIELTKKGAELMTEGAYKYFSPEIVFKKTDEETWQVQKNLLIGGAFTNRPFFKAMQPLLASENGADEASNDYQKNNKTWSDSKSAFNILAFNSTSNMNKFLQLVAKFYELATITKADKVNLENAFNEIPENERSAEMQTTFSEICAKFSEDGEDSEQWQEGVGETDDSEKGEDNSDKADQAASWKTDEAADKTKADDQAETVSATDNGDGTMTIQASEFKNMQAQLAKMVREWRKNELTKKVEAFKFSEWNKVGVVLPKHKNEVVDFALSLSEPQSEKFLKIISNLQTIAASEIWHSTSIVDGNADKAKSKEIQFFTEKLWMTAEQAEQAYSEKNAAK